MSPTSSRALAVLSFALICAPLSLGAGCSSQNNDTSRDATIADAGSSERGADDPCATLAHDGAGTVAATAANVAAILRDQCASCHTPGGNALVFSAMSPRDLIAVATPTETCGGQLIVPGHPESSYLFLKISQVQPCAGEQMPAGEFGSGSALPSCQIDLVRAWIAAGSSD